MCREHCVLCSIALVCSYIKGFLMDFVLYLEVAAILCVVTVIPLRVLSMRYQWIFASFAYFFTAITGFKFVAITK